MKDFKYLDNIESLRNMSKLENVFIEKGSIYSLVCKY